jgi:ribosomal protein S24E
MKTIMDFKNDLLKRREIKLIIEAQANPGFSNALKMIAEQFKSKEEEIVVKTVKSKFGRNTFLIDAFIYDSAQDKARIEPKKKVKKGAPGQEQPQAAGGKK